VRGCTQISRRGGSARRLRSRRWGPAPWLLLLGPAGGPLEWCAELVGGEERVGWNGGVYAHTYHT